MSIQIISRAQSTLMINREPTLKLVSPFTREEQTHRSTNGFSFSRLPPELRHEICKQYFLSLPPVWITESTFPRLEQDPRFAPGLTLSSAPNQLHMFLNTHLALSSPVFATSVPPQLFYTQATFSFTSPRTLASFTALSPSHSFLRNVRVSYGRIGKEGPDWVFALHSCLPRLESVVFVVERQSLEDAGEEGFERWWECVRGAVREGAGIDSGGMEGCRAREIERGVLVCVEDEEGEEVVSEQVSRLRSIKRGNQGVR